MLKKFLAIVAMLFATAMAMAAVDVNKATEAELSAMGAEDLGEKLEAIAAAGFDGVEIFENDIHDNDTLGVVVVRRSPSPKFHSQVSIAFSSGLVDLKVK